MEAGKKTLNDIFNGNRILEIPFFQRSYVWKKEQWERLLEDMENISQTGETHFLGSVILKQQETSTEQKHGDVRILVDGQQRITTINIFFKVLCLKKGIEGSFDRMFRLMEGDIALKHNHNDIKEFNKIMGLEFLEELDGKDNITQAYNYFNENMDPDKLNFKNILNSLIFVVIDLMHDEDEQQIFDTINSLGVKLTTSELLKNYFFDRNDIKSYEDNWVDVFEKDDDTSEYWYRDITSGRVKRTCIDLFFYSFLQIKLEEDSLKIKSEDKVQFSRVEKLFESYKKFIKDYHNNDKGSLIKEIREYALLFKEIFNPEITSQALSSSDGLERVNLLIFGLDTGTLIPYILFIEKNEKDKAIKNELYEILESYVMRRIVAKATTKNYNQLFTERLIHNKILSKEMFTRYIEEQSDKVNYWPCDEEMKKGFFESKLTNKQAAGVLYLIESKIRSKLHSTQLLGFNKYSLEHLMPKKWENHWGMPDNQYTPEDRNSILLTLGNLTIITQSLNSSVRDSKWDEKVKGSKNSGGLKKYTSGIDTIESYLDKPGWNEQTIKQRAEFLSQKAAFVWNS